jgi:hypothetical protein
MLTAKAICVQIQKLTYEIIGTGLCDAQNFPSFKTYSGNVDEVTISNAEYSLSLKDVPYAEMFRRLSERGIYNIKMIDGALISMSYRFRNDRLVTHRLSFFPSPDLETFQNEPELYLHDELYSDIMDKRIVTVPIRFDFDGDERSCKPIVHPISHLTLGQYENCRIPVVSALTPYQFLSFIMINFYHTAHTKYNSVFSVFKDCFEATVFAEERELIHINTPIYKKQ